MRTEEVYIHWIKRFIFFHQKRHPAMMATQEVELFLNHLAQGRQVSASTQSIALNALVFLYTEVLNEPLSQMSGLKRVQRVHRVPVVLSIDEVKSALTCMDGTSLLMA